MTQQEYKQQRRECWEEFCKEHPLDATANGGVAFCYAFDRAYALGKEKETISQEEIEKAAQERADSILYDYRMEDMLRDDLRVDMINLFKDAVDFALGKQEKDATMQQDYKSGELECWCDFCNTEIARRNSFDRALVRAANNFAFFRGYRLCKQDKDADTVIQGWVARDKGGFISLFSYCPDRVIHDDLGFWGHNDGSDEIDLPKSSFPDITWESDPIEVELIIKRKKK